MQQAKQVSRISNNFKLICHKKLFTELEK